MIALIAIALLLVLLAVWVGVTYNRLVALRLTCESSWAQIDVALKLRHDLVPVLAEAVAGYAGHEQRTLNEVATARGTAMAATAAGPAERGAPEGQLGSGLGRMMILAEDYPELKASENFASLQSDLSDIEEKISITRRVYNDTVERYNTKIQVFPSNLVAGAFRFSPREFFAAGAGAEIAPQVTLGGPAEPGAE